MRPQENMLLYCGQGNVQHRSRCPKEFGSVQQVLAHLADELLEQDVEDATENALISSEEIVLIQTAKGNSLNPTNRMQMRVQMLYNSGSQRTYISERFARKLNLMGAAGVGGVGGGGKERNSPCQFRV